MEVRKRSVSDHVSSCDNPSNLSQVFDNSVFVSVSLALCSRYSKHPAVKVPSCWLGMLKTFRHLKFQEEWRLFPMADLANVTGIALYLVVGEEMGYTQAG